ncbi:MAG TPA: L-seryl-tRNA(Sec) selenium transferase, partial [Fimbriimonas sp.]
RAARNAVERVRGLASEGVAPSLDQAVSLARQEAELISKPVLGPLINMSGVVCHTGLGRARLAEEAVRSINHGYTALEFDLETGRRGDRQEHVRGLLRDLTGAEDALVVNNAAAALFLSLKALAEGREVVLSRGQMVGIGGSFRLPDIVRSSGCRLVEIGCTNQTNRSDYEGALGDATAAILRCHPSNYSIVGFTTEVPAAEMADVARAAGVLLIDDQGSGLILETTRFGMPRLPTVQDSLLAGADVVLASGDKLLGGPQAGLILGTGEAIAKIRRHPLARTVRVDKLTLSVLAATLRMYRDGREREVPTWRYLGRPLGEVLQGAERLRKAWSGEAVLDESVTEVGSGVPPGTGVPTWRVGLAASNPDELLASLRRSTVPIVGRIERDRVWLDPRTAEEDEIELACRVLSESQH